MKRSLTSLSSVNQVSLRFLACIENVPGVGRTIRFAFFGRAKIGAREKKCDEEGEGGGCEGNGVVNPHDSEKKKPFVDERGF